METLQTQLDKASTDPSAEKIKEDYTYVCQDIVKEFKKYDSDPYKYFARFAGEHSVTGRVSCDPDSETHDQCFLRHLPFRTFRVIIR